jgi:hypothetical protein
MAGKENIHWFTHFQIQCGFKTSPSYLRKKKNFYKLMQYNSILLSCHLTKYWAREKFAAGWPHIGMRQDM